MKHKHKPSKLEVQQEIKLELRKKELQNNISLLKKDNVTDKGKIVELIVLVSLFAIFSIIIAFYYIFMDKDGIIHLLQFVDSLITFGIGLVIGYLKK